jgi:uncharacterized membrane protein
VLVLIGIFMPGKGRAYLVSAFLLMLIGTVTAWIAVSTGAAAGELAERTAGADAVLENHESLAETTRNVFTALTVVFGVMIVGYRFFGREGNNEVGLVSSSPSRASMLRRSYFPRAQKIMMSIFLGFLLFYGAGVLLLVNTAHAGGRLVHELGIRAMMSPSSPGVGPTSRSQSDDDD